MVGSTLNHYEIIELLGAGGMGEVYRAHDTTLKRDVAIKVLPEDLSADVERLARLEREAQLLASLNHPGIAAIHSLEEPDGVRFLVLELVEGDTLAVRLERGRVEVDEAVEFARQMAQALEAAHDSGIIHRDLKPANIKITPDNQVKVLDFGLAKAYEQEARGSETSPGITKSPTVADATRTGMILGTAAYMSPEQARVMPLDNRTDIWSFGCVLFEMLTGQRPFQGSTMSDTLAAILRGEPDWDFLPAATPASVRTLLRRCLRKDPGRRLHHIADARIEIEEVDSSDDVVAESRVAPPGRRGQISRAIAVLVVGFALGSLVIWGLVDRGEGGEQAVRHMSTTLGAEVLDLRRGVDDTGPLAVSPDGSTIVYQAQGASGTSLFLHRLDERDGRMIEGTEDAIRPFFSPDGAWIGYTAPSGLWKVPVSGGAPTQISGTPASFGATWAPDDTIIHTPRGGIPLHRVAAGGGEPEQLTELDAAAGEQGHNHPSMLPDGRSVLFTIWKGGSYAESSIAVLSLETLEYEVILEGGSNAVYAPSGHLVYAHRDQLLAIPFALETQQTTGTPVPVIDGVFSFRGVEQPVFSLSAGGTLAYVRREPWTNATQLVWVDRDGNVTAIEGQPLPADSSEFRLSRDGRRLTFRTNGPYDIWTYILAEGYVNKVTLYPGWDGYPTWADDDQKIAFSSARSGSGAFSLWWKSADGMGEAEELLPSDPGGRSRYPLSASPYGVLAFRELHETNRNDIWLLPLEGDRSPQPFATTSANEFGARFSPDGEFLAYHSDESGVYEVYVEPVPQTGERIRVSRGGGATPFWSADGAQLFFQVPPDWGSRLGAARIDTEPRLAASSPELFFEAPANISVLSYETNQGFLGIQREPLPGIRQIEVVLNFFEELKQRVPTER